MDPTDYVKLAASMAQKYGIDPNIFVRQMDRENKFRTTGTSSAGASGIAQIMPDTARDPGYGVRPIADTSDPVESLRFAAEYMRAMLDKFGGDYSLALAAYNAGARRVTEAGGVPPIKETQDYVSAILGGTGSGGFMGGSSSGGISALAPAAPTEAPTEDTSRREVLMKLNQSLMPQQASPEAMAALGSQMMNDFNNSGRRPQSQGSGIMSIPEARSTPTVYEKFSQQQ
jgi:hypothetical protein